MLELWISSISWRFGGIVCCGAVRRIFPLLSDKKQGDLPHETLLEQPHNGIMRDFTRWMAKEYGLPIGKVVNGTIFASANGP